MPFISLRKPAPEPDAGLEDVDLSKVLLDLKTQDVNYQTAIAVTARVLQPTLMDFLR